jgi:hypothetical protein
VADLFDLGELPSWLQVPQVDTATETRIRRYVNGWLQDATGLDTWPSPVPDKLWAWAIELAGIVYENPTAKWSETIDDYATGYDHGPNARRTEILAKAQAAYNATSGKPSYSFPEWDWQWTTATPTYLTD